uniref:Large ribosomal subunit protein uL29 n=1 Tax=uncultured Thiotrichaceae bacterium TaxID=298394 RepID=A0A6S6UHN8_9GAMM|nr:MAG: LSU ribosomal protein L29p (L35e) [uncultured Thiotrichaceae bacterium]
MKVTEYRKELREKSEDELRSELTENYKEQFKLRMQQSADQMTAPSEMKRVRRQIARIKTILSEKKVAGE